MAKGFSNLAATLQAKEAAGEYRRVVAEPI
jgi:hypothetical protein